MKYDQETGTLTIRLVGAGTYDYADVDQHTFDTFMSVPSKGSYYTQDIKGRFEVTRTK